MLKRLFQWAIARKADDGVTLIELLAVIVILAIIAAIAIPVVLGSINSAKVNTTEQDLSIISEALNRYNVQNGVYPSSTSPELISSISGLSSYVSIPEDAWGYDFYYESTSNGYIVGNAAALNPSEAVKGQTEASTNAYYITNSSTAATNEVY